MTRSTPALVPVHSGPRPTPPGGSVRPRAESQAGDRPETVDTLGMGLLAAHVPLTLLLDLAPGEGPGSGDILTDEQPTAEDLSWLAPSS